MVRYLVDPVSPWKDWDYEIKLALVSKVCVQVQLSLWMSVVSGESNEPGEYNQGRDWGAPRGVAAVLDPIT